jgi:hypothetical protein
VATSNRNKKKSSGRSAASTAKKTSKKAPGKAKKAPGKAAAPAKAKKAPGKAAKTAAGEKAARKGAAAKPKGGRKDAIRKAVAKKGSRKRSLEHSTTEPPPPPSSKRNFGLRGAAPWVARHAAKHAEELRKRNAEPPPPGSARATLRVPPQAEQIKSQISQLHQLTSQVRNLRKRLDKTFFEIGELLDQVQLADLHVAKGYSSFESFLDREIDLPRTLALKLIRISHTFQKETAYDFGLERLSSALAALDGELPQPAAPSQASSRGFSSPAIPLKPPPIRFDE